MTTTREWRGPVGDVWATEWRRTDRSFAELSVTLDAAIQAAAPAGRGHALDIGCGAGTTTLALAAACPDLTVTGIDVSAELIDVARDRAERGGFTNARFATGDLEGDLPETPAPDLVFSRHGVMFTDDPSAMFARLHDIARPGGALVFSCFRSVAENPWAGSLVATLTGATAPPPAGYAPGPFGFADAGVVRDLLTTADWSAPNPVPVDYAYVAGAGADPVADAVGFLSRIGPVAAALRDASDGPADLRERLTAELTRHREGDRVAFPAAAWLWSAHA